MEKSKSSYDPRYIMNHEGTLMGCTPVTYPDTQEEPSSYNILEEIELFLDAMLPLGLKRSKGAEREINNLLLDAKTETNSKIYYTKDIINLFDEQFKPAIEKSIEYASKKMRNNNLKEVNLTGAGEGFTLVKLGVGGHGGGHTFRKAEQTNKDI